MTYTSNGTQTTHIPLISIILPTYNEEAFLEAHLTEISTYLKTLEMQYRWELLVINDGSIDRTGAIADKFAQTHSNVRVLHHPCNFGLGQALRFGFANTYGDYVVTMDIDLSYSVTHIGKLVEKARETQAKIVIASPYMSGGSISNVPFLRAVFSRVANKFLSFFVGKRLSTITSMMRVYDGSFIKSVDLRALSMDILPETIYKSMVLRAHIVEIPGHLDWGPQLKFEKTRVSSMRPLRHTVSTIISGFIFRPFAFLVAPGLLIGVFSVYVNFWMFIHYFEAVHEYKSLGEKDYIVHAFARAYSLYPHTFITAMLSAMLAIQLVGLGAIALQNKRYFEDLFHLSSSEVRQLRRSVVDNDL